MIKVLSFGSLTELLGNKNQIDASDTDILRMKLLETYPDLASRQYIMAVNTKMITENTVLQQGDEVALLPPYSGG